MRLPLLSLVAVAAFSAVASATPVVLTPNEAASKDTFVYSSIPSGLPFGSASYVGASIESTGVHTVNSLIQFDLTGVSLAGNEKATFSVSSRSKAGTPFSTVASDPSATAPVTVDLYIVTSAWDESSVTWSTKPSNAALPFASYTFTGIGQTASIDVTSAVSAWLANPATNFGLVIKQQAISPVPGAPDAAVVLDAAGGTTPPSLAISVVPEPGTFAAIGGLATICLRRRR